MSSAESRLSRIRDRSGNGSARIPAGTSGGTHIWSWRSGRQSILLLARPAGRNSWSTATAIGSSAPMPAILHIGSEVSAMDKRSFQNETAFQMAMYLARRMLAEKLITGKEYRDFEQEMLRRYQPFSGDLYT